MAVDTSSSGRISFGGLASGLDTGALVDALIEVERQPLLRVQSERADVVRRQGLLRELNSLLLALRDAARGLDNRSDSLATPASSEEFLATSATSSNEAVLQVTSRGSAAPGSHLVRVNALATTARVVSAAYAAETDVVGAAGDTISLDYGGAAPIAITLGAATTLAELAGLVEADPNNDGSVQASLLDDGQGGVRLILTGRDTGSDADIIVTTSVQGPGAVPFVDAVLSSAARDASLTVFGVPITRTSSEIADAIPGVTLKLVGTHDPGAPADAATVSVARDDEAIAAKLDAFVNAYNAIRTFALKQATPDAVTKRGGPLSGDAGLRFAERSLQDLLGRAHAFAGNPFSTMSSIGLRFERDGKLSLDRVKLAEALDADPGAVRELLSGDGTTDGVMTGIARTLEPLTRSGDGVFAERISEYDHELRRIDRRIATMEERLAASQGILEARFAAMEQLIASLSSSAAYLDRAIASGAFGSSDK
ncbi:MAG: hypothetical protein DCC71_21895 [Proteobacteria bacterium]|nr:MAG: hypothetical protein DCC71_21895 [Pseudomonadota bacterium]